MPSAIEEVFTTLQTAFEAAGLNVEIDRGPEAMLDGAELPAVALSWLGASLTTPDSCEGFFWKGQVQVDCWAKVQAGVTVLAGCNALANTVASVVQTEQRGNSFGGKFHECRPISVGDLSMVAPDVGCLTVTLAVQFFTAKGDWTAILT